MKYRSPSPPCLHPQLSPQGQRPSPPVQLSGVLIAKSALAHLGPLLCTMPVPLTFILKRVPSAMSTSIPRVACAGMGRKALLWSRAELGLLPGLSVPICEARKMMAPPHGCCEDELSFCLKLRYRTRLQEVLMAGGCWHSERQLGPGACCLPPHLLETETACPCVHPATGPAPWPLQSEMHSTITTPQLPQDLCGSWGRNAS